MGPCHTRTEVPSVDGLDLPRVLVNGGGQRRLCPNLSQPFGDGADATSYSNVHSGYVARRMLP